jgi:hypothetical protein
MMDEADLDALLKAELAPPHGAADMAFVTRVDRMILEAERYNASRAALKRQLATESLAIGAIGGGLAVLAAAPGIRETLSAAPGLGWTGILGLMLVWLLIIRSRAGSLA